MKGERIINKLLFELLTSPLGLPIEWYYEYIIMFVIGKIAFSYGWEKSPGGPFGSIIHYFYRTIAFFVLWAIVYGGIYAYKYVCEKPVLIIVYVVGILFIWYIYRGFKCCLSLLKSG